MSALASILVRDNVISVRKIEEALQRQVVWGGDLDTVLLEMGAVPENTLAAYCAALAGVEPASREEIAHVPAELLESVPAALATRHRIVPLSYEDGLLLLATDELPAPAEQRLLRDELRRSIGFRMTTHVRLAVALHQYYGVDLEARYQRIAAALSTADPGTAAVFMRGAANSKPAPAYPGGVPVTHSKPAPPKNPQGRRATEKFAFGSLPSPAHSDQSVGGVPSSDLGPVSKAEPQVATGRGEPRRPLRRFYGPMTLERGRSILGSASDRDDILAAFFAFARQFFEYSALFVVRDELAEGWAAFGPGASTEDVLRIAIPLDLPSVFSDVAHARASLVADLANSELGKISLRDLDRAEKQPALLLPIALRGRTVLLFYGDRDGEPFTPEVVSDVIVFAREVAEACERVILQRKTRSMTDHPFSMQTSPSPYPPSHGAPSQPPSDGSRSQAFDPSLFVYRSREAPTDILLDPSRKSQAPKPQEAANRRQVAPRGGYSDPRREEDHAPIIDDIVTVSGAKGSLQGATPTAASRESAVPSGRTHGPPSERARSVIVDMGDNVQQLVAELSEMSVDEAAHGVQTVLGCGEAALPMLVQAFPGRLWHDPNESPTPAGRDLSGVARALCAFGPRAVPYLVPLFDADDVKVRGCAILVAKELAHPQLCEPLGRQVFDSDPALRSLALESLVAFCHFPEFEEVLVTIRMATRIPSSDLGRRHLALQCLTYLRDGDAVPALIDMLKDDDRAIQEHAQTALTVITREDFGSSRKKWFSWFQQNRARHRVEWLIDALMHSKEDIREAAFEELQKITNAYLGYHPAAPKRDRERVQTKYRDWWQREGRPRFHR